MYFDREKFGAILTYSEVHSPREDKGDPNKGHFASDWVKVTWARPFLSRILAYWNLLKDFRACMTRLLPIKNWVRSNLFSSPCFHKRFRTFWTFDLSRGISFEAGGVLIYFLKYSKVSILCAQYVHFLFTCQMPL